MSKFKKVLAVFSSVTALAVSSVPITSTAAEMIEYPSGTNSYKATVYTENDGKFEGGAEYHYNPETKGLVIDGKGSFTIHDFNDIYASFDIDYTVVCKDVIVPENDDADKPINTFIFAATLTQEKSEYVFTYKGSDMEKKYNDMMDFYESIGKEGSRNVFVLDLLDDGTDPYTFAFTPEESKSDEPTEATEETINWLLPIWEKVTLKGDADLDGIVSLSDVIAVSKYSLSHNLYPLKNDVAYVNADMNQDGDINAVDTSALIEINLGKKSG